jgi:hypothetical protein
MVTRHLNGGAVTGMDSTVSGTSISRAALVGNFANAGERRHNHTTHRFDFRNTRNLSTSFNTSTLVCATCTGEHMVLRREIEEDDVGFDTPPQYLC